LACNSAAVAWVRWAWALARSACATLKAASALRQTGLGLLHGGLGRVDLGAQVVEPVQGLVQIGLGLV